MTQPELSPQDEALVQGWATYTATKNEDCFQAWSDLTLLSTHELERSWQMVLALVERVPEEDLPAVGVGPLENLIHAFPNEVGLRAASLAKGNPRFRTALARVWISRSKTPPGVREQLVLATDGQILILT